MPKHTYAIPFRIEEKKVLYLYESSKKLDKPFLRAIQTHVELTEEFFKLPGEELKDFLYTEDLENFWCEMRQWSIDIGWFFFGNYLNCVEDILDTTKLNAVQKLKYDFADAVADKYLKLYNLVKHCFKKIKTKLSTKYENPEQLFIAIVKYKQEAAIVNLIQADYFSFEPSKLEKITKNFDVTLDTHGEEIKDVQLSEIKKSPELEFFYLIEKHVLNKDEKAKKLSSYYETASDFCRDRLADIASYRNSKKKLLSSLTYNHGQIRTHDYGRK